MNMNFRDIPLAESPTQHHLPHQRGRTSVTHQKRWLSLHRCSCSTHSTGHPCWWPGHRGRGSQTAPSGHNSQHAYVKGL
jgi:hypothetical protein